LSDNVRSTYRSRFIIIFGNADAIRHFWSNWIGCAIDKPQKVSGVKISKSSGFIDNFDRVAQPGEKLALKLESNIPPFSAYVKEKVPGGRHSSVFGSADLGEDVQLFRLREAGETIPDGAPNTHNAAQVGAWMTDSDILCYITNGRQHRTNGCYGVWRWRRSNN
jgi:hypothetical protein